MSLTKKQLEHLALLSRLKLDKDDKDRFQKQLSEILDFVAVLQKVDVSQARPFFEQVGKETVWREDVVEEFLDKKALLNSAPAQESGFVKTKAIFNNDK